MAVHEENMKRPEGARTEAERSEASRGIGHVAKRHERRRRRREAMTLVEIMIVVIIMALIATGVAVAVMPQWEKANIRQTSTDAQNLKSAAQLYLMDHNECPSNAEDLRGEYLDDSKRAADAWDNEFKIECEGSNIYVTSSGPDEQFGTEDDIE